MSLSYLYIINISAPVSSKKLYHTQISSFLNFEIKVVWANWSWNIRKFLFYDTLIEYFALQGVKIKLCEISYLFWFLKAYITDITMSDFYTFRYWNYNIGLSFTCKLSSMTLRDWTCRLTLLENFSYVSASYSLIWISRSLKKYSIW